MIAGTPKRRTFGTLLEGPNPFSDVSVRASGGDLAFDVGTIGADLKKTLVELTRATHQDPARRTRSLLVTGEPGSGKSHALRRTRASLRREAFVTVVDTYGDHRALLPALLPAMLDQLAAPAADGEPSWLERVLVGLCYRAQIPEGALRSDDPELRPSRLGRQLAAFDPDLNRSLLTLLIRIIRGRAPFPPARLAHEVGAWLGGAELHPDVQTVLERRRAEPPFPPLEALQGIAYLLRSDTPVVIALDALGQLVEGTEPEAATAAARGFVADLCRVHDLVPNCVLVILCRTEAWFNVFEPSLKTSERARVTGRRLELEGLEPRDAQKLVAARIEQHLGREASPYPTFPFRAELLGHVTPASPRELLGLCARETGQMRLRGQIRECDGFGLDDVGNESARLSREGLALARILDGAIDEVPEADTLTPHEVVPRLEKLIRAMVSQKLLGSNSAEWRDGLRAYERLLLGVKRDGIDAQSARALLAIGRLQKRARDGEVRIAGEPVEPDALLRKLASVGAFERRIPIVADLIKVLPEEALGSAVEG